MIQIRPECLSMRQVRPFLNMLSVVQYVNYVIVFSPLYVHVNIFLPAAVIVSGVQTHGKIQEQVSSYLILSSGPIHERNQCSIIYYLVFFFSKNPILFLIPRCSSCVQSNVSNKSPHYFLLVYTTIIINCLCNTGHTSMICCNEL